MKIVNTMQKREDSIMSNTKNIELTSFQDWLDVVDNPDLISEGGQQEIHKTKGGKGSVGQAIAKDKLRKLPPNCS